jgi:hypothetical protein
LCVENAKAVEEPEDENITNISQETNLACWSSLRAPAGSLARTPPDHLEQRPEVALDKKSEGKDMHS